uniref:Uncharacterized protein n=1 Tax=Euplotes harpa TaxID=151035 RepID=A0A7S3JBR9_9SPIT|mmetsp:Transcript_31343/g.35794  ORF Transcript_31343/g.35794 Transcript_31343/m.35794 type:complete len:142 (+) Transcript_31343:57-482(+)
MLQTNLNALLKGYNSHSIPKECLDASFRSIMDDRLEDATYSILHFASLPSDEVVAKVKLVLFVIIDEIINDCLGSYIIIDFDHYFYNATTTGSMILLAGKHVAYALPAVALWMALYSVLGSYSLGRILDAIISGRAYPWDY